MTSHWVSESSAKSTSNQCAGDTIRLCIDKVRSQGDCNRTTRDRKSRLERGSTTAVESSAQSMLNNRDAEAKGHGSDVRQPKCSEKVLFST